MDKVLMVAELWIGAFSTRLVCLGPEAFCGVSSGCEVTSGRALDKEADLRSIRKQGVIDNHLAEQVAGHCSLFVDGSWIDVGWQPRCFNEIGIEQR